MNEKRDEELCDTNKLQTIVQSCFVLILCNKSIVCCSPGFWIVFINSYTHFPAVRFRQRPGHWKQGQDSSSPAQKIGMVKRNGEWCIWSVLWLQNFLCQRQRKNQQEQYCEQTSSIYYVERIPPLGYIMNLYQLQIRKICVEKSYKRTHCI